MSRKIKSIKIVWKYAGDENPEKKRESEQRVEQAYNIIFNKALEEIKKRGTTSK